MFDAFRPTKNKRGSFAWWKEIFVSWLSDMTSTAKSLVEMMGRKR